MSSYTWPDVIKSDEQWKKKRKNQRYVQQNENTADCNKINDTATVNNFKGENSNHVERHVSQTKLTDKYDDDDEIVYFTVRWKTRASFVYRTKNIDNTDKDSKNRKRSH